MKKQARDYRALLASGRWFAALPDEVATALLAMASLRQVPAGGHVFSSGDPACGIYAVVDGAVRVAGMSESGKEILHMVVESPGWFGELSAFDHLPRNHDAIADVETLLVHVAQPALDAALATAPIGWFFLGQLLAQRLRLAVLAVEDGATVPALVRLARRLSLMSEGYGDHTHRRRSIELGQEQLAAMLGLSRQTINGLLKELEARGLVRLAYGEVEIVDATALAVLARVGAHLG
jgi:CRP-like cAMP-binding protein